ncbi:FadR/GntR family transcriptional regulator [Litchfieldia alkalitelluris]|uniref:FadR/GntR family transcriptional regulator n=1 Tax=Litchfieldia alkalitelluris TaxID=304268 RepID=UPI000998BE38|nr:FadR/GntR family transcriptional regulator [Litchfieldia alkalitelluris]
MAKKVSSIVMKHITDMIRSGQYTTGSKLPSERELREMFKVGRSSVREALSTLVDMDVVEKRNGVGVFVKKTDLNHLVDTFVVSALLDSKVSREILDFRLILEVETAGIAALMATEEDLLEMELAIQSYSDAIDSKQDTVEPDELFHKAIVMATRNSILLKVYHFISDLLHSFKIDLVKVENKENTLYYHQKIYDAIKKGNEKEARQMMREHLLEFKEQFNDMNTQRETECDDQEAIQKAN